MPEVRQTNPEAIKEQLTQLKPKQAARIYKGTKEAIQRVADKLQQNIPKNDFSTIKTALAALKPQARNFETYIRSKLNGSNETIPLSRMQFLRRLVQYKNSLKQKYLPYRLAEEKRLKESYKETSIENIKFRKWQKSDLAAFSQFLKQNAGDNKTFQAYIQKNLHVWNPKGNPKLYYQQQCVEMSLILLIEFCYKNHIDLALPASNSYLKMSKYKTLESFMKNLYPKLSASHLYSGAGGLVTEIREKDLKAGDWISIKRPHGGYHALIVTGNYGQGQLSVMAGSQMNKDFRKSAEVREEVEEIYPKGFVKIQSKAKPNQVKMRYGGYAIDPMVNRGKVEQKNGTYKFYRLNVDRMNQVLSRIK